MTFYNACLNGDIVEINELFDNNDDNDDNDMEWGFEAACKTSNIDLVTFFINRGIRVDQMCLGFRAACKMNHSDIINMLIKYGVNSWDWGLSGACWGGHINIINDMIQRGVDDYNLHTGLCGACENGHIDAVKLMISYGVDSFRAGLWHASSGGNIDVVKLMLNMCVAEQQKKNDDMYIADQQSDLVNAVNSALGNSFDTNSNKFGRQKEIVELLVSHGANDWNKCMMNVCRTAPEMVGEIIENGADDWNEGLYGACISGNIELVIFMIKKGANNFNKGFGYACSFGRIDIVKILLDYGATDYNLGVCAVSDCERMDPRADDKLKILKILLEKGATNLIDYQKYFKIKNWKLRLLELGVHRDKLIGLQGIDEIFFNIDLRRKCVEKTVDEYLLPELVSVVGSYVVN